MDDSVEKGVGRGGERACLFFLFFFFRDPPADGQHRTSPNFSRGSGDAFAVGVALAPPCKANISD